MVEETAGELVRRLQGEEIDRLRAQWPFAVTRPERI